MVSDFTAAEKFDRYRKSDRYGGINVLTKDNIFMKCNSAFMASKLYSSLSSKVKIRRIFNSDAMYYIHPKEMKQDEYRLNLLIPNFGKEYVFAGISAAIKFMLKFAEITGWDSRVIIVGGERYNEKTATTIDGYIHNGEKNGIFFLGEDLKIPVGSKDIFIATSWVTAYSIQKTISWQEKIYGGERNDLIYLIQDFEPGFYPWSSEYVLAEETYHAYADHTVAIFNSRELHTYFKNLGYSFKIEKDFRPVLNTGLKDILISKKEVVKERKILIYGRPGSDRNAFDIVRQALRIWDRHYADSKNWKILSLGEKFDDITLKNNKIHCEGKVTLDEYADEMFRTYAGISLMVSPHPSYPPLEMSAFGIKTITNRYANKDLSYFNPNIVSLDRCMPEQIAKKLMEICNDYNAEPVQLKYTQEYMDNNDIPDLISEIYDEEWK